MEFILFVEQTAARGLHAWVSIRRGALFPCSASSEPGRRQPSGGSGQKDHWVSWGGLLVIGYLTPPFRSQTAWRLQHIGEHADAAESTRSEAGTGLCSSSTS